ncbi:MAG: uroporphyrinogen-III synthase [Pseudomarimonas sp.]
MLASSTSPMCLRGWTVIGLRASNQQAPLRRASRAQGASFLSLPGLRLLPQNDPATRENLAAALARSVCIFSSPAAVRFARQLANPLPTAMRALAIGNGTAAALRRAGIRDVQSPSTQMRSEGLLAMGALLPPPARVGLVTAPGGRGEIARTLRERGAEVCVAEVYRRESAKLTATARRRLLDLRGPIAVLLSSEEALRAVHSQLSAAEQQKLLAAVVVCASPRLGDVAEQLGFSRRIEASSTQPKAQLAALASYRCQEVIDK